jgi:hypothetical protein
VNRSTAAIPPATPSSTLRATAPRVRARGLAGVGLAVGEQVLLLVLHGLELGDDRVRGHLVPVEQPDPAPRGLVGPDVGHEGGQDRRPLPGQSPDPLKPGGLAGVVVDQAVEVVDGLGQLPAGALVGREVAPLPGEHVPDHPGLDKDADLGDLALDLHGVQHRPWARRSWARATPNSTVASSRASSGMAITTSPLARSGRSAHPRPTRDRPTRHSCPSWV